MEDDLRSAKPLTKPHFKVRSAGKYRFQCAQHGKPVFLIGMVHAGIGVVTQVLGAESVVTVGVQRRFNGAFNCVPAGRHCLAIHQRDGDAQKQCSGGSGQCQ